MVCYDIFDKEEKDLFEWNETVQKMIDWIEAHLTENPSLLEMSNQIGYSPYYCSNRFHEIVGMTFKSYVAGRRLVRAALEIRDTKIRILDIAIKYGYSSQEALTRAFMNAFGCTPAAYRNHPVPIVLSNSKVVCFPEHYESKGEVTMSQLLLTEAEMSAWNISRRINISVFGILTLPII